MLEKKLSQKNRIKKSKATGKKSWQKKETV